MKNVTMTKRTIAAIAAATMAMSAMATTFTISADNIATTTSITADSLQNVKYSDTTVDVRQAYNAASATIKYNVSGDFAFNADGVVRLGFSGVDTESMTEGLVKSMTCTVKSGSTTTTIKFTNDEELEDKSAGIIYVEDFSKLFTEDGVNYVELNVEDFPDALTTLYKTNKNLTVATTPTKTGMVWSVNDSGWEVRKAKAIDSIAVEVVLEKQTTVAPTKKELNAIGELFEDVTLSISGDVREYTVNSNVLYLAATYDENRPAATLPYDMQNKIDSMKSLSCYLDFDNYIADMADSLTGDNVVRFDDTTKAIADYLNNGLIINAYRTNLDSYFNAAENVTTKTVETTEQATDSAGNLLWETVEQQQTDASGNPVWELESDGSQRLDANGDPIPVMETVNVLDSNGDPIPVMETVTIKIPVDGEKLTYWYDSAVETESAATASMARLNSIGVTFEDVKVKVGSTTEEVDIVVSELFSGVADIRDVSNRTEFAQLVKATKSGSSGPLNNYISSLGYLTLVKDAEYGYVETADYTVMSNYSTLNTALNNITNAIEDTKAIANVSVNTRTGLEGDVTTATVTEARPLMVEGNMWTNIGMLYTDNTGFPLLAQLNSIVENNKGCKLIIKVDPTTLPEVTTNTNVGVFNQNVGAVGAARLRVNGAYALTYNDMASYDTATNTYTFDWDAVVNGKSMDATMAVWSLELATYNPLGITAITVSVPDQEAYANAVGADKETEEDNKGGSLDVGEGREDENDILVDLPDEEIQEETNDNDSYETEDNYVDKPDTSNNETTNEVVDNPDTGDRGILPKVIGAISTLATIAVGAAKKNR